MSNNFEHCEKTVSLLEIEQLENNLKYKLPNYFIEHYLKFNGGIPLKSWWYFNEDIDPLEIAQFKSIKYYNLTLGSSTSLIDNCYYYMIERNVIPQNIIPFAIDWGGNFFCINQDDNSILFYTVDSFNDDLTLKENHKNAQLYLAPSFNVFINNLMSEEEINGL
jgi:hypothetical protein